MRNDNELLKTASQMALEAQRREEERARNARRIAEWRRKRLSRNRASNFNIIKFPTRHAQRVKGRYPTPPALT